MILDTPERSVRLWNEINPTMPATLVRVNFSHQNKRVENQLAWSAPFIQGKNASDSETMNAVINIFNKTQRIIYDANNRGDFIPLENGTTVCVDIGVALKMPRLSGPASRQRLLSDASKQRSFFFKEQVSQIQRCMDMPKTISTIKALSFIASERPDIVNVLFLKSKPELLELLSRGSESATMREKALTELNDILPVALDSVSIAVCDSN